jgi:hemerythrin superfamily protein
MDDEHLTVPRNHDIVTIIIRDHEAVAALLDSVSQAEPSQRQDLFWTLSNELARHEVAEEIVLYPAVRLCSDAGGQAADAGMAQQADVERLLAELDRTGLPDSEFPDAWAALADAVKIHATFEEGEILPLLVEHMTDVERFEAGDHYAQAKKRAPTHPHPQGGLATNPLVAAFDRLRDAMHPGRPRSNRTASP